MWRLHSAYWFDLMKDWSLYWEEEWLEYVLNKVADREMLLVNNWDVYVIDDDVAYFVDINWNTDILHCTREMNELGINFIFNEW